jgi:OmpA-OmpF porin, OOP family
MRAALLAAGASALAVIAVAGGVHAQQSNDPADVLASVRVLDPVVRSLEPVVRELQTEERTGTDTTVTISSDVLFAFDSAELADTAARVVGDLATRIASTDAGVTVVGHTDGVGTLEYNQDLSERRAVAVAEAIRAELGDGRTIATEGRNFSEPVAPETVGGGDDPAGRARNRRVEITFEEPS